MEYVNMHRYNNRESRWCDQQKIPYVRDGYAFGTEVVEDLILKKQFYHLCDSTDFWKRTCVDLFVDTNKLQHKDVFQEDEWLIIEHSQRYVRAQIKDFGPRNGRMWVKRYDGFTFGLHPNFNYSTYRHPELNQDHTSWWQEMDWCERKAIAISDLMDKDSDNKEGLHRVTDWNIFAVNKETLFKLKLLQGGLV